MSEPKAEELDPNAEVCGNCFHGIPDVKRQQVLCRRFPPLPVLMQVPNPQAVQAPNAPKFVTVSQALPPPVAPDWSCSEFAHKVTGKIKLVPGTGKVTP